MKLLVGALFVCALFLSLSSGFVVRKDVPETEVDLSEADVTNAQITQLLNDLVAADVNAAQAGDVSVDYQNMASHKDFDHDNAKNPFFKSVSPALLAKPTYAALLNVQTYYSSPTSNAVKDLPTEADKTQAITAFIDAINKTQVVQKAGAFLYANGLSSSIKPAQLTNLWFTPATGGVSGFNNVFAGATKNGVVTGLNNWVRFYELEKAGQVNYHGWYEREENVQVSLQFAWNSAKGWEQNFLLGTSPEFDFAAYTICAVASPSEHPEKTCTFKLKNKDVTLNVETITQNGLPLIIKAYPTIGKRVVPTGEPSGGPTGAPTHGDGDFQALVDQLWQLDVDRAQPGDIVLNWGKKLSGKKNDVSLQTLFTTVNEALFQRPVYKQLIDIYNKNYFHPTVCTPEETFQEDPTRKTALDNYLRTLTATAAFNATYEYLVKRGKADPDPETFHQTLFDLWYGTYSRCHGPLGSSGWEHVFSGEWREKEVDGQHNWVRYYLLEKAGAINYFGYDEHDADLIGTFKYVWNGYVKAEGGFLISTSPAFDLSLFTACVLTEQGSHGCRFKINDFPLFVTSYSQPCALGKCLSTSYPGIST